MIDENITWEDHMHTKTCKESRVIISSKTHA